MMYSADGREICVEKSKVSAHKKVGWYETKEQAQAAKKAEEEANAISKNKAVLKRFYVGQTVSQWLLISTRYGSVLEIDYTTGKVLVYWMYAEDSNGKELNYLTGALMGVNSETWENASSLTRLS